MSGAGDSWLDAWGNDVPLRVDTVAEMWWRMISVMLPWRHMPIDDAYGELRRVLRELFNEARDPHERARTARLGAAAHQHGLFRRHQQCGREALSREVDLLAEAIEESLHVSGLSEAFVADVLIVLGPEMRIVREGAFAGWSAGGKERRGQDERSPH